MNDEIRAVEDLLRSAHQQRQAEEADDHRWERLASGDLSAEEAADLAILNPDRFESCRPFDPDVKKSFFANVRTRVRFQAVRKMAREEDAKRNARRRRNRVAAGILLFSAFAALVIWLLVARAGGGVP